MTLQSLFAHVGSALSTRDPGKPKFPVRSRYWPHVRHRHLLREPLCAACGKALCLEVHHIKPYHLFPELELDPENLITLCESTAKCHLLLGHLGDWRHWNPTVLQDTRNHRLMIDQAG